MAYIETINGNPLAVDSFVTPEQFGAVGDGVTDDTAAINRMFSVGKPFVLFSQKTYKVTAPIDVDANGINIIGNGCTIASGSASGFRISETSHDIEITGINFVQSFEVGSTAATNYGIGILGSSTTALYQAYNIHIAECSFTGGVLGISATNCQNIEISNCQFGSFVYKPSDAAGGYAILEQSCVNVYVHDCHFKTGDYGRHSIYVSVNQQKTENKMSRNVTIERCYFDNSDMTLQASGAFYSPNTSAITIRHGEAIAVNGCTLVGGTAIVTAIDEDGAISASITDCTEIDGRYLTASGEAKSAINISCSNAASRFKIDGFSLKSSDGSINALNDASLTGGTIEYGNSTVHYRIYIYNVVSLHMHDVTIVNSGTLHYAGSGVLAGKFERIKCGVAATFPAIDNGGSVDWSMYDEDAKSGYYLVSNGGMRYPAKAYMPVTAAMNGDNDVVFTFPSLANRPWTVHAESMTLGVPKIYTFNMMDSGVSANQLRMRVYNASGTQLTSGLESKITF